MVLIVHDVGPPEPEGEGDGPAEGAEDGPDFLESRWREAEEASEGGGAFGGVVGEVVEGLEEEEVTSRGGVEASHVASGVVAEGEVVAEEEGIDESGDDAAEDGVDVVVGAEAVEGIGGVLSADALVEAVEVWVEVVVVDEEESGARVGVVEGADAGGDLEADGGLATAFFAHDDGAGGSGEVAEDFFEVLV